MTQFPNKGLLTSCFLLLFRAFLINGSSRTMCHFNVYCNDSIDSYAVLLVMFNKAALSSYKFPFATVVSLSQVSHYPLWFVTILLLMLLIILNFSALSLKLLHFILLLTKFLTIYQSVDTQYVDRNMLIVTNFISLNNSFFFL